MSAANYETLRGQAERIPGVTFVRSRPDLVSLVAAADAVVSMGGYNSVWEAVAARKRPIIVPRRGGSDEQPLRAERLSALGLAHALAPDALTPERLAEAIAAELERESPPALLAVDGMDRAGVVLAQLLRRR
jgi:predicted glycosyltransferase